MRVFRFDETAALLEPFNIDLPGDIVLEPHPHDQENSEHERKGREVVCVFGDLREGAERVGSDQGSQEQLSESDVETRDAEDDEGRRGQPMNEPLKATETRHLAS